MEAIGKYMKEIFNKSKKQKNWCKWCYPDTTQTFVNKFDIEGFIDDYFLFNMPEGLSISHNHQRVRQLIHTLLVQEYELTMYE